MLPLVLFLCLTQGVASDPLDDTERQASAGLPPGVPIHPVFNQSHVAGRALAEDRITSFDLTLHGGPVMEAPNVYVIWYGRWTHRSKKIIKNFIYNVGETAWWKINTPYGVGKLHYKKSSVDLYSQGHSLTLPTVWSSVIYAFSKKLLPQDPNGIYLVLSSSDVTQVGFCTTFCGWHYSNTLAGVTYKFGWIGIPPPGCSCFAQPISPNGDAGLDGAVSVIAHELIETATDPTGTGWCYSTTPTCTSSSVENGDQCAWYFPRAIFRDNYNYNLVVGDRRYYVQANWNLLTRTCDMM